MRVNYLFTLFLTAFASLFLDASFARAEMKFCNHTEYPIEAAFGSHEATGWVSEGWWRIDPAQCARVSDKPLTQRFYFYYAASLAPALPNKQPLVWTGKYQLCTGTKAFHIEGDGDCETRNYYPRGFQEIDIGATARDYTLDFKDVN